MLNERDRERTSRTSKSRCKGVRASSGCHRGTGPLGQWAGRSPPFSPPPIHSDFSRGSSTPPISSLDCTLRAIRVQEHNARVHDPPSQQQANYWLADAEASVCQAQRHCHGWTRPVLRRRCVETVRCGPTRTRGRDLSGLAIRWPENHSSVAVVSVTWPGDEAVRAVVCPDPRCGRRPGRSARDSASNSSFAAANPGVPTGRWSVCSLAHPRTPTHIRVRTYPVPGTRYPVPRTRRKLEVQRHDRVRCAARQGPQRGQRAVGGRRGHFPDLYTPGDGQADPHK